MRLMKGFISLGVLDPLILSHITGKNCCREFSVVKDHEKLNKIAAQESMVLLRNDGTLPINVGAFKSVALIGPCADDPDCNTGLTPIL
jgi:beta-glucosidase-like glycosyl hydrolase